MERPALQIIVRDNNVDQALRALKKKLQREGVYREMKLRRHYEKPSEKRARERAAAIRRARKLELVIERNHQLQQPSGGGGGDGVQVVDLGYPVDVAAPRLWRRGEHAGHSTH